jgi:hypothetical protein
MSFPHAPVARATVTNPFARDNLEHVVACDFEHDFARELTAVHLFAMHTAWPINSRSLKQSTQRFRLTAVHSRRAFARGGRINSRSLTTTQNLRRRKLHPILFSSNRACRQRTARAIQEEAKMGGGPYRWMAPAGVVAAGSILNPNYGKMAAESIAKEVEERKIATQTAEAITSSEEQAKPATGTEK